MSLLPPKPALIRWSQRRVGGSSGLVLAFAVFVLGSLWLGLEISWPNPQRQWDLGSFLASGWAAASGQNPYGVYQFTLGFASGFAPPNFNPPITVPLFALLARVEPLLMARIWYGASLVAYVGCLLALARRYPHHQPLWRIGAALSLAALWHTLSQGQLYVILLLAVTGAWLGLQQQRPLVAGCCIAVLVAVKPPFVLWPLLLLLAGHWRVGLTAGLVTMGLSLVPLLLYGPTVYAQWLAVSADGIPLGSVFNHALYAFLARLAPNGLGVAPAMVLCGLLLGLASLVIWRRRPSALLTSELALLLAVLFGPVTWSGYTMLLVPGLFARPHWSGSIWLGLALLSLPLLEGFLNLALRLTVPDQPVPVLVQALSGLPIVGILLLLTAALPDLLNLPTTPRR